MNNGSAEGQIEKLRQYATQDDIAGVAISVIQADNLAIIEEMRKLQKKGVKIITVDGDVNRNEFRDARSYYIGTDNVVGGRTLGTATKALLQTKGIKSGGYIQYAGFTDNDNARSRMNGVKEAIGDSYTPFGTVVFAVWGDDKKLWESDGFTKATTNERIEKAAFA